MKRFSIILFGALAILMASCSKHAQPEPEFEPWVNDLSLPVPIQFGTPNLVSPDTKAAPIKDASNLEGKRIGVFAIDKSSNNWTDSESILMNNVIASSDRGKITFSPTQYYPVKSDKNYTFYGYYVYSADVGYESDSEEPIPTGDQDGYYVTLPMGNIDYLWAKSEATAYNGLDGFNAKYIREITKGGAGASDKMPKFEFKHITAGVDIKVQADPQEAGATFTDIKICSVCVNDAVTKAKLCIAHRTKPSKEGTFVSTDPTPGKIEMTGGSNSTVWLENAGPFSPTIDGVTVGHGLFLYPGKAYKVTVYYKSDATKNQWTPFTFTTSTLQAGYKYTYTLLFHSSKSIDINVSVLGWEEGSTGEPMDTSENGPMDTPEN